VIRHDCPAPPYPETESRDWERERIVGIRRLPARSAQNRLSRELCNLLNLRVHKIRVSAAHQLMFLARNRAPPGLAVWCNANGSAVASHDTNRLGWTLLSQVD
jgi:hypothetical protein